MSIGSITTDYSALFQNYRVPSIPSVDIQEVAKQQEKLPVAQDFTQFQEDTQTYASEKKSPAAQIKLEDISLSFNKSEDYSLIGSESELEGLDIQKAISDMRKDQVLQQYQYFVSPSYIPENGTLSPEGKIIIK